MNYELAKKLKKAGFPQSEDKYCKCSFLTAEQKDGVPVIYDCKTERVSKPTLYELIMACGEDFMLTNECGDWEAFSQGLHGSVRMGEGGAKYESEGQTPEEAVANLWLELNKNNKTLN